MNQLFNDLNQNSLLKEFDKFKAQFSGDPKEQVQRLLDSGRMTQAQFDRLSNMATQFQTLIGRR